MKKNLRLFLILYLAGFGGGVLAGDLFLKKMGYQTSLLSAYMSSDPDLEAAQFFGGLFFQRGKLFFLGAVCGVTILGMFLVAGGLLWSGFLGGNLAVLFLTQWGIRGVGAGLLSFPQSLFYIPGWFLYFFAVLQMSRKSLAGAKRTREDYKAYFFFLSMAGVLLLLGIWSESYVNQKILAWIIENHL